MCWFGRPAKGNGKQSSGTEHVLRSLLAPCWTKVKSMVRVRQISILHIPFNLRIEIQAFIFTFSAIVLRVKIRAHQLVIKCTFDHQLMLLIANV